MRPHLFPYTNGMFVLKRPPGRLGKRAGRLGRKGAVVPCSDFKHLRFATPARGPLHDSYASALSRLLGPSQVPGLRSSRAARARVARPKMLESQPPASPKRAAKLAGRFA